MLGVKIVEKKEYNTKKEYHQLYSKRYYQLTKEKNELKRKEYYFKNREKINKVSKEYYLKNKKKYNDRSRDWYNKNKEKSNLNATESRNKRKREAIAKLSKVYLIKEPYCLKCGSKSKINIDHKYEDRFFERRKINRKIITSTETHSKILKMGSEELRNKYQFLCQNCNIKKAIIFQNSFRRYLKDNPTILEKDLFKEFKEYIL